MDAAGGIFNGGADAEFGIGREGVFAGGERGGEECVGHG
jgi:hypothetical protein